MDNDGDLDFYITRSGSSNYLLRNNIIPNETETFTNTAAAAGVQEPTYGVDCRFVDFDNDGFIDLYVTARLCTGPKRVARKALITSRNTQETRTDLLYTLHAIHMQLTSNQAFSPYMITTYLGICCLSGTIITQEG